MALTKASNNFPGMRAEGTPREIRLGLIGAGPWGRNYIKTIAGLPGSALTCLASRNPESRALVDKRCDVTGDWMEVARNPEVDGVIIASPPALHAPMVRAAVDAGKPVLVEKPFTLNLKEARDTLDFVERQGGYFLVDHVHLFHPAFLGLKKRLPDLGPVQSIEAAGGSFGPFRPDTTVLWDWGPHDIAMCCDLMGGPPQAAEAKRVEQRSINGKDGESIELTLTFAGGVRASIRIGNLMARKTRFLRVNAAKGSLIYDDQAADKLVLLPSGGNADKQVIDIDTETPLSNVVRYFVSAVGDGVMNIRDSRFGVTVVEVLDHCEKALER